MRLVLSRPVREGNRDLLPLKGEGNRIHPRHNLGDLLKHTLGKNHKKLIASHAYRHVAGANGSLQPASKFFQGQVACGVSVLVVNLFEAVEVGGDQNKWLS